MKVEALNVGLKVSHPQYGVGVVKSISEHSAEVRFDDGVRTVDPERSGIAPAEPTATFSEMQMPLEQLLKATVESVLDYLGYEKPNSVIEQLGARWHRGSAARRCRARAHSVASPELAKEIMRPSPNRCSNWPRCWGIVSFAASSSRSRIRPAAANSSRCISRTDSTTSAKTMVLVA